MVLADRSIVAHRMPQPDHRDRSPLLVVLTGGIASGKSAVSDQLAHLGVPVVDTDLIARQVVEPGSPGLEALVGRFGDRILEDCGRLDRARMREIVFSDANARKQLEEVLHPLIEHEARHQIERHRGADYVLVVVPLLVESGLFPDADRVVVVDVPEPIQLDRLTQRDGIDHDGARQRLAAQAGREARLAVATDVIDNSGSRAELRQQVEALNERLTALSHCHRQRQIRSD